MSELSRRQSILKIAVAFNGFVGVLLGIPIVRYVLSPMKRESDHWIPLGTLDQFPAGETRLATFRSPVSNRSDGDTAELPCWVRNVDGSKFQVFAINCAQSNLFMCPCHGGAYYADGSRASGPPERGLFEYPFKVLDGKLHIQAGELPTPGLSAANRGLIQIKRQPPCA